MHRRKVLVVGALFISLIALISGCRKESKPQSAERYDLEGKVVSVNKQEKELTIAHKEIPNYMKAMTMPFKVKDAWVLDVAQPGDAVAATLVVTDDDAWIENIAVNKSGGSQPEPSTSAVHNPQPGDPVPDFTFTDQDGKKLSLSKLKGHPLLVTFIYSRCPLPDYCIRMSNNFKEVARELKEKNPEAWKRSQLLSVSFDPEYDTPKVLNDYGKSYAGQIDPKFEHWKFVTAPAGDVRKTAEWFGLSYEKQSDQIIHSLRTALIGPDGKIVEVYKGNEWNPADVAKRMAELK